MVFTAGTIDTNVGTDNGTVVEEKTNDIGSAVGILSTCAYERAKSWTTPTGNMHIHIQSVAFTEAFIVLLHFEYPVRLQERT